MCNRRACLTDLATATAGDLNGTLVLPIEAEEPTIARFLV